MGAKRSAIGRTFAFDKWVARWTVVLARTIFCSCSSFCTCVEALTCDRTPLRAWTAARAMYSLAFEERFILDALPSFCQVKFDFFFSSLGLVKYEASLVSFGLHFHEEGFYPLIVFGLVYMTEKVVLLHQLPLSRSKCYSMTIGGYIWLK